MEYHEFRTQWEYFKKQPDFCITAGVQIPTPAPKHEKPDDFYAGLQQIAMVETVRGTKHSSTLYNQVMAERNWYKLNKPYYKVGSDMLHLLSQTSIDVPCEFLHSPFESFSIRLPVNHGIDFLTVGGNELRAMLVDESKDQFVVNQLTGSLDRTGNRVIVVWMDFGEVEENNAYALGSPISAYNRLLVEEKKSIEKCLANNTYDGTEGRICDEGIPITVDTTDICFRIAVSVCFLATGADKIVEPDVLTKDLQNYLDAKRQGNEERITQLANRAVRKGKRGWTVGREITFPGSSHSSTSTGTGEELRYSHQRSAHFHTFRHGPGRSQTKIKFVRQLTVRPDLPPSPSRRGYKG